MQIAIAGRLRPFSHRPGILCPIPRTSWHVQIYPTRLIFYSQGGDIEVWDLPLVGPIEPFTVELDLEQGKVHVFGQSKAGHFRYDLLPTPEGICLHVRKSPASAALVDRMLAVALELLPLPSARLSLGVHRAADWDLIVRRADIREWFPFVWRMGMCLPHLEGVCHKGTFALLPHDLSDKRVVAAQCRLFWKAALTGMLMPRLVDTDFQGIVPYDATWKGVSPLPALKAASLWMQALFFLDEGGLWHMLPCLLPDFHAGRFTGIQSGSGEEIAFEWSKHQLQKMIVVSSGRATRTLKLPKGITQCRLRRSPKDRGTVLPVSAAGTLALHLEQGTYWLDRFFC